jgi:hypothetical protein
MVLKKRMCVNHPERQAVGICTITRKPICAECSTRYEGVNYSKEGLRILQERRAAEARKFKIGDRLLGVLLLCASPVLIYFLYLFYLICTRALVDLGQQEW